MKKSFLLIGILAVATLFNACNKNPEDAAITSVKLQPEEVTLAPGDQVRLSVIVEPSQAKGTYVWTSSNEEVATVSDNGTVIAINLGEAVITCEETTSKIKAQSKITVVDYYKTLAFTQCYLGIPDWDSINTIDYHHDTYGDFKVHVCKGVVELFSEGFYINADRKLDGTEKGAIVLLETPVALALAEDNPGTKIAQDFPNGVVFSLGFYGVGDYAATSWHQALKGSIDEAKYIAGMQLWVDDYNKAGKWTQEGYELFQKAVEDAVSGTVLKFLVYECAQDDPTDCGYYYYSMGAPDALITKAEISVTGDEGSSPEMNIVEYLNMDAQFLDGDWGMELGYTADSALEIKSNKLIYIDPINYTHGTKPENTLAQSFNGVKLSVDHAILPGEKVQVKLPDNFTLRTRK
jgi:hypothetical protein